MAEEKLSNQLDTYLDRARKTIQLWIQAHTNAELQRVNGNIIYPIKFPLQMIYDYVTLDAHLSSVIQQRKSKVLGEEFAVVDESGNINEEATKLLSKQWFSRVQEGIIDSRFYGYNLLEIGEILEGEVSVVKTIQRGNVIPELRAIVKNPYQVSAGSLIPIDSRNDSDYYILVDSETLGILNQVVPHVMIKRTVTSYWSEHATVHGMPATVLKTDNKDQIGKYQSDMQRFIQSRNIVIGLADEFQVIANAGGDPHAIYGELINICNWEISKAIVGQTSTSDEKSYVGSAEVHERVANEISEADREYMTYVVNDIVFPKLIALGYRIEGLSFKFITKEKRSYAEKLNTIDQLRRSMYRMDGDSVKAYLDLPFDIQDVYVAGSALNPEPPDPENLVQKKSPVGTAEAITELYLSSCYHDHHIKASADGEIDDLNRELEGVIDQIIEDVYFNRTIDVLNPAYIKRVADLMSNAVFNEFNFNGNFASPDFDSQDLEFFKALQQKVYYFTGGKNAALTKSFNELLLDSTGNVKAFNQFKKDCKQTGLILNQNHLKTEYQLSISSAQSISDWRSFEDDDVLQYDAIMDQRTRPEHARLNGLELKKTDSLWNSITPPLGYNCRCRLLVVPSGKAQKLSVKERKEFRGIPDEGFRYNPAKNGDLFPPSHPYLKTLTAEQRGQIDNMME